MPEFISNAQYKRHCLPVTLGLTRKSWDLSKVKNKRVAKPHPLWKKAQQDTAIHWASSKQQMILVYPACWAERPWRSMTQRRQMPPERSWYRCFHPGWKNSSSMCNTPRKRRSFKIKVASSLSSILTHVGEGQYTWKALKSNNRQQNWKNARAILMCCEKVQQYAYIFSQFIKTEKSTLLSNREGRISYFKGTLCISGV